MQNAIASAKKITVHEKENICGMVISALTEQKMPLLDNELLWAVRDHWQHRFLEKQQKKRAFFR